MLLLRHLRHDPADPTWPDRDRLFCAADAVPPAGTDPIRLAAPPGYTAAAAVGAALAERALAGRFGRSLVDHRTWLLAGRAELAAGAMQEAACLAGAASLDRLTAIVELPAEDASALAHFASLGWAVRRVPAGDLAAFETALAAAARAQKPTLIACLHAGESTPAPAEPAPDELAPHPRAAGARRAWLKRQRRHASAELFLRTQANRLPPGGIEALTPHGASIAAPPHGTLNPAPPHGILNPAPPQGTLTAPSPAEAVRAALPRLASAWPELAGLANLGFFAAPPAAFPGRSVPWGERAQAIAGGLLGMALHGGLLPAAGLEITAIEAALPCLRIAAERGLRTLYLAHETAPLPEGMAASLRALPDARIFRPADAAEAMECLALALRHVAAPSLLLLGDPIAPPGLVPARACARGGYMAHEVPRRDVTLIASGAELHIAQQARYDLGKAGVAAAIVSLPCWQLFALQDEAYREAVLGAAPRIGLEPGGAFGWDWLLGAGGGFIDTRGAPDVAAHVLRHLRRREGKEKEDVLF